jgi:glycosidase
MRTSSRLLISLLVALLLTACARSTPPAPTPAAAATAAATPSATAPATAPAPEPTIAAAEAAWWLDATFYEIFVRSFYDTDGDGVGDLKGLIEKLDYLNDGDPATNSDLGITGIWLMPIMQSPSYHGYDVVDYRAIDDEYGTNEDFQRLMEEAHQRGIRVIVDLVMNHTSAQHPWFLESSQPDSAKRDWYVWSADAAGAGWHSRGQDEKYYGYFGDHMPDLNYDNPEVTEAMYDIARFWLDDMGVDGFRLDAIKYMVEEGKTVESSPGTMKWLESFKEFYKGVKPDAFAVGEVWMDTMFASMYVPERVDAVFEFTLADSILKSAQAENRRAVERAQQNVATKYGMGEYATFIANHDQVRTRSRLLNEAQAFTAASLQMLYGGTPFIYYGEEIGMMGKKPDENLRRPMQWTSDGGFTTGKPWNAYYEDVQERNVAGQDGDPDSLLNHYRSLIRLRSTYPALRTGDWRPVTVPATASSIYSAMRSLGDERFLVLINLDDKPVSEYELSLEPLDVAAPVDPPTRAELVYGAADGAAEIPPIVADAFTGYKPIDTLPPYSTFVIRYYR